MRNNTQIENIDMEREPEIAMKFRYPGSRPFNRNEVQQFFGRDDEVKKLVNRIELEKLTLINSKSGLGKTSLINAGLIPQLEELKSKGRRKYTQFINFRFNDSDNSPSKLVLDSLKKQYDSSDLIDSDHPTLWDCIKTINNKNEGTPVLIFDQFEELFNYYSFEDRKIFTNELATLINDNYPKNVQQKLELLGEKEECTQDEIEKLNRSEKPLRLKIIIAIRSDKLSLLDELSYKIPSILNNRYKLKPLNKEQAKLAIIEPAQLDDDEENIINDQLTKRKFISPKFTYESGLVNRIVNYLAKEKVDGDLIDTDNVESFQLQILCQFLESKILKRKELGNTNLVLEEGLFSTDDEIERVLNEFYEMTIGDVKVVPKKEQENVKKLIENGLIVDGYRNIKSAKEIISNDGITKGTLINLVNKHLLRHERRNGVDFYEISHDTLVAPIVKAKDKRLVASNKKLRKTRRFQKILIGLGALALVISALFGINLYNKNKKQKGELEEANAKALEERERYLQSKANNATTYSGLIELALSTGSRDKTLQYGLLNYIQKNKSPEKEFNNSFNNYLLDVSNYAGYKKSYKVSNGDVISIAVSKNGMVLTGGDDNIATLWNNREEKRSFNHTGNVYQVGFFKGFAVTAGDYVVNFWNIKTGKRIGRRTLDFKEKDAIRHFTVNKQQDKWAVGTTKGSIFISQKTSGKLTDNIVYHNEKAISALKFMDGDQLISAGDDRMIQVNSDSTSFSFGPFLSTPTSLASSGDTLIAAGFHDGMLRIWKKIDFEFELQIAFKSHQEKITDVAFSEEGNKVATSSIDRKTIIWDLEGDKLKTLMGHKDQINAHAFDPTDENKFYTVSQDNTMKEWNLENFYKEYKEHEDIVTSVVFDKGNSTFISGSTDGVLYFGDRKIPKSTGVAIYDLEKINNNQLIIAGRYGIKSWDLKSSSRPKRIVKEGRYYDVTALDKNNFAACNSEGQITLSIDGQISNFQGLKEKRKKKIYALDYCQEKKWLIGGCENNNVMLWNIKGDSLGCLKGHEDLVKTVAISKDGGIAVSGSWDNSVIIWDINSNGNSITSFNIKHHIKSHSSDITKVEIFEEKNTYKILTASNDHTVRLWRLSKDSGRLVELKSMINHRSSIKDATFSKDGSHILTCGLDMTIKKWSTKEAAIDKYFSNFDKLEKEVEVITSRIEKEIENQKNKNN